MWVSPASGKKWKNGELLQSGPRPRGAGCDCQLAVNSNDSGKSMNMDGNQHALIMLFSGDVEALQASSNSSD